MTSRLGRAAGQPLADHAGRTSPCTDKIILLQKSVLRSPYRVYTTRSKSCAVLCAASASAATLQFVTRLIAINPRNGRGALIDASSRTDTPYSTVCTPSSEATQIVHLVDHRFWAFYAARFSLCRIGRDDTVAKRVVTIPGRDSCRSFPR